MSHIFLATLGQRPEAITMALDILLPRYRFAEVIILHTEPYKSGIAKALASLKRVMAADYPGLLVRYHELTRTNGSGLLDIEDEIAAYDYMQGIQQILEAYKRWDTTLHLLIAGGRKAMTVFAAIAAAFVFTPNDYAWTVLSPEALLKHGVYHAPPLMRNEVQLVNLPILTARNIPGVKTVSSAVIQRRRNMREDFLSRLTPQERILAEAFRDYPYASDQELAHMLIKAKRTVQNQLRSIYEKFDMYFDNGDRVSDKRRLLADLMQPEDR